MSNSSLTEAAPQLPIRRVPIPRFMWKNASMRAIDLLFHIWLDAQMWLAKNPITGIMWNKWYDQYIVALTGTTVDKVTVAVPSLASCRTQIDTLIEARVVAVRLDDGSTGSGVVITERDRLIDQILVKLKGVAKENKEAQDKVEADRLATSIVDNFVVRNCMVNMTNKTVLDASLSLSQSSHRIDGSIPTTPIKQNQTKPCITVKDSNSEILCIDSDDAEYGADELFDYETELAIEGSLSLNRPSSALVRRQLRLLLPDRHQLLARL